MLPGIRVLSKSHMTAMTFWGKSWRFITSLRLFASREMAMAGPEAARWSGTASEGVGYFFSS
jgi:hypothetical protein